MTVESNEPEAFEEPPQKKPSSRSQSKNRKSRRERAEDKQARKRILGQLFLVLFLASGFGCYVFFQDFDLSEIFAKDALAYDSDDFVYDTSEDSHLPIPSVSLAITGRVFYLVNDSGTDVWPSCKIYFNGEDQFFYEHNKEVKSNLGMDIPLRSFLKDGEAFSPDKHRVTKIIVIVPGFRKWESDIHM